jgi:outer membrane protein assembly factor BamB
MHKRSKLAILAVATLGALAFPAASASAASPAGSAAVSTACPDTAHHEDAKQDGYNCSTIPQTPALLWSTTLDADASYPVIAGGRVFVTTSAPGGSYGGDLYALDAATGKVLWGPVALTGTYYYFALAYESGRVFVNDFDGTVTAFNAANGTEDWSTATSDFSSEPVAANGTVWVQSGSVVYGLSEKTGAVQEESTSLDGDGNTPAVSSAGVFLSGGCSQFRLSLSATVVWSDNSGCDGGGGGPSYLSNGRMYSGEGDVVLAQSTGKSLGAYTGSPAFAATTGYFADGDIVSASSVVTGEALWSATLSAPVADSPVVTPSAVWVATSDSKLVALDPANGSVLSTSPLPAAPGGGGQYSGVPSDLGVGNNIVIVPTGATVSAFG